VLLNKRFLTEFEKSSGTSCFIDLLARGAGDPDKVRLGGISVFTTENSSPNRRQAPERGNNCWGTEVGGREKSEEE